MAMPQPSAMAQEPAAEQSSDMPKAGGAAKLVTQINDMLMQLGQLLDQAQVLDPKAQEKFAGILSSYQDFVENDLGSAPGESAEEPAAPGNVPMETAGKPAKQAL